MFQNIIFHKNRFSPKLLEELKNEISSKLVITDQTLEIKHLYVEKRMIPLNLYLETATIEEMKEVVDDYGNTIKELAAVNIFPGDMLLKNFGVTRLKRVVFYDYDEIGLITDYNFREIPEPRNHYEEFSDQPYYHVGVDDVFPEEFGRFLFGSGEAKKWFYKLHGDLLQADFWKNMQQKLNKGEIIDIYPYKEQLRFVNLFK